MPNSYTVLPNIIPGAVTIGGNLTVQGDCVRVGAAPPFARFFKAADAAAYSYNLDCDSVTPDVSADHRVRAALSRNAMPAGWRLFNPAGNFNEMTVLASIGRRTISATFTGSTVETLVRDRLIRGGKISQNGRLIIRTNFNAVVQGATATVLRWKLGGTNIMTHSATDPGIHWFDLEMHNANSESSQVTNQLAVAHNILPRVFVFTTAIDTTLDRTLELTIQLGATTDNWGFNGWEVWLMPALVEQ